MSGKLTAEELDRISKLLEPTEGRYFDIWKDRYHSFVPRLLAHIEALEGENERLRERVGALRGLLGVSDGQ